MPLHEHVQALNVLENVLHERQRRFDHCVQVLKREKEKLRVLEERGVVPPHELQSLRSHFQSGKNAIADAVRDLYECKQQIKRRRLCESILADGMTDFHKSVNIGNHFPAEHIWHGFLSSLVWYLSWSPRVSWTLQWIV